MKKYSVNCIVFFFTIYVQCSVANVKVPTWPVFCFAPYCLFTDITPDSHKAAQ